ncbi:MAG: hypothetical protein GZ094_08595 [Mariniphaga sp.]|nr:hypothetical protein [Mariniphaga sp.]
MNNTQESTLSMSLGTLNYFDKNAAIASLLPGVEPLITKFRVNVNAILVLREQQEIDISGISGNKKFLRADLAAKAFDISRKTEVYASLSNNLILEKEVHFAETSLTSATDSKLESRSLIIYERANSNIDDLMPYGVTEDDLIALQNAIDLFHASVPAPRTRTTEKKQITNQLVMLFQENAKILEKIDLLVELVRLKQSLFYSGYKDSRKIILTGTGSLALIAIATDAATGEVIKGVKFTFVHQNENGEKVKNETPLVKVTAQKGKLNIKNLAEGPYITIVEKVGFKKQELLVNKAAGDRIKLDVKLEKI